MPRSRGSYGAPRKAKACAPRWMRKESRMKRSQRWGHQVAAMELAPITTSGKAICDSP